MEQILVYILLEVTLFPTVPIITQWSNQTELQAEVYFLFYTLAGRLPLSVALGYIHNTTGSLNFCIIHRHGG